jgi:CheY-like chemotaxis protein
MPKILLVDDAAADRRLFSALLEKEAAFAVHTCEDGASALQAMQQDAPDVVVTDMQMPNMDGLELVREIRRSYPHVPVILMTGKGSEELAAQALKQGAAGYVPKSRSKDMLRDTVWHVLELSGAEADYQRLIGCASLCHFDFVLENDVSLIPPLLDLAQRMVGSMGLCDTMGCLQAGVALKHAILNAIYHGNLQLHASGADGSGAADADRQGTDFLRDRLSQSPYKDRRVHVSLRITREEARFQVRDEGPGFDVREVAEMGLSTSLHGKAGQGLFLMWAFMDKVSFNKAGNVVTLIKQRATPTAQPAAAAKAAAADGERRSFALPEILAVLNPKEGGKPLKLSRPRVIVGREPSCDLVINSRAISHHHCVLYLYEGWWYVKDLNSRNGVKVKRVKVTQHLVPPGSVLSIGPLEFEMNYTPHELGAPGITPPVDPF